MSQGSGSAGSDLHAVLEYLQGLGWEDVYVRGRASTAAIAQTGQPTVAPSAVAASAAAPSTAAAGPPFGASPPAPPGIAAPTTPPSRAGVAAPVASADRVGEIPADPAGRAAALAALASQAQGCMACKLAGGRKTVVFGTGDPNADLMFIGEGPGAEEDRQGLPFVGPAGQLLTRIIQAIGLGREQVYIANVVKCRPPGNRDPQPDEVAACRSFLEGQIRLVQPKVIVALGRVAGQTLLGNDLPVGRLRGQWFEVLGVPVRVTYHPAAILRDASYKRPTWDDMQLVRDVLAGTR